MCFRYSKDIWIILFNKMIFVEIVLFGNNIIDYIDEYGLFFVV